MNELLQNINFAELLTALWTAVLLPILTYAAGQCREWLASRKLDQYGTILYQEVSNAVKCIYETEVKDIKNTADWTAEKQEAVKELAKTKAIQALSSSVYRSLKQANEDFDSWLDSLVGTALYDIKHPERKNTYDN